METGKEIHALLLMDFDGCMVAMVQAVQYRLGEGIRRDQQDEESNGGDLPCHVQSLDHTPPLAGLRFMLHIGALDPLADTVSHACCQMEGATML